MIYSYRCITWRDGAKVYDRIEQKSSTELYSGWGIQGELAFIKLLNSWNASVASNGDNFSRLVHKYIYLGCQ